MKSTPPHALFRDRKGLKAVLYKGVALLGLMAFVAQPVMASVPPADAPAMHTGSARTTNAKTTRATAAKASVKEASKSATSEKTAPEVAAKSAKKARGERASAVSDDDAPARAETKSAQSKPGKVEETPSILKSAKKAKAELTSADRDDDAPARAGKSAKSKSDTADETQSTSKSARSKSSKSKAKTELASAATCEAETRVSSKSSRHKPALKTSSRASGKAIAARVSLKKISGRKSKLSKRQIECARLARAEKPETPLSIISFAPAQIASLPRPYEATKPRVPARSFDPSALSPADVALYRQAFDQTAQGQYDDARTTMTQISDRSLIGYVEYSRLVSAGYESSYEELTAWMTQYGDLPVAMKIWGLAKRKKPAYAPDPAFPVMARGQALPDSAQYDLEALSDNGDSVRLSARGSLTVADAAPLPMEAPPSMTADLTPKSARSAYNDGKLEDAIRLGGQIGDHWVAGLANYRLKRYADAEAHFEFIAKDPSQNAWNRSGGAYWAGRCALLTGRAEEAQLDFKLAASFPFTFYGLVAEQKLGIESAVTRAKKGLPPLYAPEERSILSASLDGDFNWAHARPEAKRVAALILIDRRNEARAELQSMVQRATDQGSRDQWLALAAWSNLSVSGLKRSDKLFDFSSFEVPDYQPRGGFTLDRALVYALTRKESKFNPKAVSYSGAYGLMQLMPATAALITADPSFKSKPAKLLKPSTNLRVGQDYIHKLLDTQIINGDLLRAVAAYNGGPRPVQDALRSLGPDADSLLVMESIPVAQSRAYVEEVVASYWIYQKLMDKPSQTLQEAAADARIVRAADDAHVPAAKAPDAKAPDAKASVKTDKTAGKDDDQADAGNGGSDESTHLAAN